MRLGYGIYRNWTKLPDGRVIFWPWSLFGRKYLVEGSALQAQVKAKWDAISAQAVVLFILSTLFGLMAFIAFDIGRHGVTVFFMPLPLVLSLGFQWMRVTRLVKDLPVAQRTPASLLLEDLIRAQPRLRLWLATIGSGSVAAFALFAYIVTVANRGPTSALPLGIGAAILILIASIMALALHFHKRYDERSASDGRSASLRSKAK